jgi:hypothetical protein
MIRGDRASEGWLSRRSGRSSALWAGGGFIAGIAFWHLVGFWSLINMAVIGNGGGGQSPLASSARTRTVGVPLETGSVRKVSSAGCVALVRNPRSGETRLGPCLSGTFHHLNAGVGTKDDLAAGEKSRPSMSR